MVILAAALALRLDRFWYFSLPEDLALIVWPLLVGGSLLIVASAYELAIWGGATGAPGDPASQLVTTGPYLWMRNPIYAGCTLLLFAVVFIARSPTFLFIAIIFVPVIHTYVCLVEEPRAEGRFGDDYIAYKVSVPRWIPRKPE